MDRERSGGDLNQIYIGVPTPATRIDTEDGEHKNGQSKKTA
jgi:hypothetical protein